MGLALAAMLLERRHWRVPRIWIPLALFIGGTAISLLASGEIRDGLPQIRKLFVYAMLFLVAGALRGLSDVRLLVLGLSAAELLSAIRGLWQFAEKHRAAAEAHQSFYLYYVDRRITGFMSHWMTFSGEMMIALLLIGAYVFFSRERSWRGWPRVWPRVWLVAAALPIAAALEAAWTRSMWLGTFCGVVFLIWFWKRWALVALPVLMGAVLLANPMDLRERARSAFFPQADRDSNGHRAELRRIGMKMIAAHPLLGIGPEQVSHQVASYLPAGMTKLTPGEYYGHLENDYIQYAAERGVPTMMALMWMIGWALVDFARGLRASRAKPGAWVLYAAMSVTLAVLVAGWYSWDLNSSNILGTFLAVMGSGYVALREPTPATPREPSADSGSYAEN
jgi:O-antigen ligase